MLFLLGYLAGLITATFIMVVLVYFRRVIEQKMTVIEKNIENAGPRQQGFIIEPMTDSEAVRNEILETNRKNGIDTKIEDLI